MRGAFFVPLCALALSCGRAPEESDVREERWRVRPESACTAMTAGWTVSPETLAPLLGPEHSPQGVLLLFAAVCGDSEIAERSTGPFSVGAVLIPTATREVVVAQAFATAEVRGLFARHGFVVTEAAVGVVAQGGSASSVALTVSAPDALVAVEAALDEAREPYQSTSVVRGTGLERAGSFSGAESSTRRQGRAVGFHAEGSTLLPELGVTRVPDFVTFDADYRWDYRVVSRPRSLATER